MGLSTLLLASACTEPDVTGHWQFVEDGSVVQIAPSSPPDPKWCAKLVRLSKEAAALPPEERRALCGLVIVGDLKPAKNQRKGEPPRLEGWVLDPEELLKSEKAERYPASLVLVSEERARLDVHGPAGVFYASYVLWRVQAPSEPCH